MVVYMDALGYEQTSNKNASTQQQNNVAHSTTKTGVCENLYLKDQAELGHLQPPAIALCTDKFWLLGSIGFWGFDELGKFFFGL